MIGGLGTTIIGFAMMMNVSVSDCMDNVEYWESIGECRITEYCPSCNDGGGHDSTSGKYLRAGHAACSWLPNGTIISIEGEEFEIVDTCGTDAIDIFRDSDSCKCNLNEYRKVSIKRKGLKQ